MADRPNIGHVSVRHNVVSASKTRPANTTGYSANDVISEDADNGEGTAWTFTGVSPSGERGTGEIIKATVHTTTGSITPQLTLLLFSVTPTSELDDNAANTGPLAADTSYIGKIDFPALESLGASVSHATVTRGTVGGLPLPFTLSTTGNLYGVLVTRDAFTPTSEQVFKITLEIKAD